MTRLRIALIFAAAIALMMSTAATRAAEPNGNDNTGRRLVLHYLHQTDCGIAAQAAIPEYAARFEAKMVALLPPARLEAERTAREQALLRRSVDCDGSSHQVTDVSIIYDPGTGALLQRAALAGDRFARLRTSSLADDDPAAVERSRTQLYEVLRSGDLLAISEIGRVVALSRNPALFGSATATGDGIVIETWLLVACDLGLECGTGSRALDLICLRVGGCGQANVADAVREVRGEDYFVKVDLQRRMLVPRIRNHDWDGMFAPVPTAAGMPVAVDRET